MPLPSTTPEGTATATSLRRRIVRIGIDVLLVLVAGFCALLLAIRFVVFPQLESHRTQIADLFARTIGQPVQIGMLASGWDGWNPRLDVSDFRVVDRVSGTPVLSLPALHLTVAWTSLLFLDLRFKELALEQPQLAVRRDASDTLHVAGLAFDLRQSRGESPFAEWLLRQRRIVVHKGSVTWADELRGAPPLELQRVEIRIENRFGHHRFGLTGAPPAAVAGALDLRGDLTGHSLGAWRSFTARLYARLDYADVAACQVWLPLPMDVRSGKGALRVWLDYAKDAREMTADVVLSDVRTKLAPQLRDLALTRLEGRLGWREGAGTRQFFAERLAFTAEGGSRFDPTDFRITLHDATDKEPASGSVDFSNLQLAPLMQVAESLPLPERWREDLGRYEPRGTLAEGSYRWTGEATAPESFSARGRFSDVGLAAQDRWPGMSGVSGSFDATQKGGSLTLQSRALTIQLPHLFDEKLALDSLEGRVRWQRADGEVALTLDQIAFANAALAGSASGAYRTAAGGPGTIDLTAQLTRADAREAHRYLPAVLPLAVRGWLRRSIVAGTASEAHLRLAGNLADFPFADPKKGQFLLTIKGRGVTVDYAETWPPITDVDGEVRIDGPHLTVTASAGRVLGSAAISRAKFEMADLRAPDHLLRIEGEAAGPTSDFLRLIAETPVADWINHVTDGAEASGNGTLALKLELPLGKLDATRVDGEYTFMANRLKMPGGAPTLTQLNGKLAFTERDVRAPQLTADVLGGTARFAITSTGGRVRVAGQGTADLSQLRSEFPKMLIGQRVSGTTDWQLVIDAGGEASTGVIESSLRGAKIDLPAPLAKAAADAVPLRVERRVAERGRDTIVVRYGKAGQFTMQRRLAGASASVERALLMLGEGTGEPDRPGLWIRGRADALNADAWLLIKRDVEAATGAEDLALAGVDVTVHELDAFGRRFNDLRLQASRGTDAWQIDLSGRELAGRAQWQASAPSRPNGRMAAQLERLTVPAPSPAPAAAAATAASERAEATAKPNPWPEIDIAAGSFLLHGRDLGKLALTAQPKGADWQIEQLQIASDDGKLSATGWWRASQRTQLTTLDAELDVADAGKYLGRFGLPDAVRAGPTKIHGQLAWAGGPDAFDYPTLSGTFRIDTGAGQFTKLDPGVGKLLGVLSLQSLQRRLTFDFRDLFGQGFAFDQLTGDVRIENGVMKSDNVRIVGPAARVSISGETDIAKETQALKIRVQPTLSAGVSVGAAVLLLANPIVGAAIGAGSLLAQKALQDPIEQMFSYEYAVGGTWSDPLVERVGRQAVSEPAGDAGPEHR